ncbi:DegV family protein [Mycoplasma mycoides]|uniref:DegV family protein n=1 Tax=Mycoplasma mycoides TaxID=2102 RepID=UPI0022400858|nr:DegV family protein [Mycoplasma mycoides]QVK05763.1 DegV family protein [Mycoplasma mycoides subsp. capri]QVK09589.1 DegV family protein [Mycoplasma mycoides subsp. capri]
MKFGILVDSAAVYDPAEFKNTIIDVIPLHIVFPNNDEYLDIKNIVEQEKILEKVSMGENIKTSQASPGELEKKYDELLEQYEHIIHIPITNNLSSMLQTATLVSQDEKYKDKITVYQNNDLAAQGIALTALSLAKAIKSNKIKTAQQAIDFIDDFKEKVLIAIIPGDLKKLSNGGRAKGVITTVLNLLKTKLLIIWAKEPKKEAIGRTYNSLIEKLIKNLSNKFKKNKYKLYFLSTPLTSSKTVEIVKQILSDEKINFVHGNVPNIYTIHAGVETIGFVAIEE